MYSALFMDFCILRGVPAVVRQYIEKGTFEGSLEMQRQLAREHDVIMDGRDIGTVVLPDADCKIFLTASAEVRARRRCTELEQRGTPQTYETVLADMRRRDEQDCSRAVAPLKRAEDAVLLDTSELDFAHSVEALVGLIEENIAHET